MFRQSRAIIITGLLFLASIVAAAPQGSNSTLPPSSSPPPPPPPSSSSSSVACNNSPALCERPYNQLTHMGAHNSAFLRDASTQNSIAGNQYYNATLALSAGLRLLQAQVHLVEGQPVLCHSSCDLLNAGPLRTWLARIRVWMDSNPNEVVSLIIVNSGEADAVTLGAEFEAAGMSKYGFVPKSTSATGDWPTLQDMITSGSRLVSFVAPLLASTDYPYLIPEFDHIFETDYEVTESTGFNCTVDRPSSYAGDSGGSKAVGENYMALINHMKQKRVSDEIVIPDASGIASSNSADASVAGSVAQHVQQCASEWGVNPQFVLVDFWDRGDVMAVADELNGLISTESVHSRLSFGSDSTVATMAVGRTKPQKGGALASHEVSGTLALVVFVGAVLMLA